MHCYHVAGVVHSKCERIHPHHIKNRLFEKLAQFLSSNFLNHQPKPVRAMTIHPTRSRLVDQGSLVVGKESHFGIDSTEFWVSKKCQSWVVQIDKGIWEPRRMEKQVSNCHFSFGFPGRSYKCSIVCVNLTRLNYANSVNKFEVLRSRCI